MASLNERFYKKASRTYRTIIKDFINLLFLTLMPLANMNDVTNIESTVLASAFGIDSRN